MSKKLIEAYLPDYCARRGLEIVASNADSEERALEIARLLNYSAFLSGQTRVLDTARRIVSAYDQAIADKRLDRQRAAC